MEYPLFCDKKPQKHISSASIPTKRVKEISNTHKCISFKNKDNMKGKRHEMTEKKADRMNPFRLAYKERNRRKYREK